MVNVGKEKPNNQISQETDGAEDHCKIIVQNPDGFKTIILPFREQISVNI